MKYKKVVIKIGTSVLAKTGGTIDKSVIDSIVSGVSGLLDKGIRVVLVSSGAIGAGAGVLKLKALPESLSDLQAIASVGQNELMHLYSEAFKRRDHIIGQILLTQEDFNDRRRYLNIKYTIDTLLDKKIVPIVNENDTVSTEEIKCGDNDRLSSLVADLGGADLLMILSDVDGLYDREGKVITVVEDVSDDITKIAGKKTSTLTKGGMATKLEAASRVMHSGIDCVIGNGRKENIIESLMDREGIHTYFKAKPVKEKAKKRWIAYSSKVKGKIVVDDGAKKALAKGNKSLLSSGITGKEGGFKAGDVVGIVDSKRKEFARGLTNYSSNEVERIKGRKTSEIESVLGYKDHDEVVHRDNLVLL
ncbi:glutamate 5-kinase [Candidatus Omnitrophota bacterium]